MSPREVILWSAYLGAIGGYVVGRTGLDKKAYQALRGGTESLMRRHAQISLDEAEKRHTALPGTVYGP